MSSGTLSIFFGLFGGLSLFIYGMNLMGDGLQKAAGEKMRRILEVLTKNTFLAVLVGVVVTSILQSSSATTVLVIGFVSARLMTLKQAIGVIMGSNIGTTITAQLIAFDIGDYAYLIAALGFILFFCFKKKFIKYIGQTIFAFGLLFIGLNIMGDSMKPLANNPIFVDLITGIGRIPVLGVLTGTISTMIIQSSSAFIAILQNTASQAGPDGNALISLTTAIPILLGSNIGTTITAILASIGSRINAKRAALAHSVFNIAGTLVFIWFIPAYSKFIELISPKGLSTEIISRQIANAHTFFNVINTILWLPFTWLLAKIVTFIIRGEDNEIIKKVIYLDDRMLKNPSIAMELTTKELTRMAEMAYQMMESSENAFVNKELSEIKKVAELEDTVDMLKNEITNYLSTMLSQGMLTDRQSIRLAGLMHVTQDIERIGDYCQNIADSAEIKENNKYVFSPQAIDEIKEAFNLVSEMVRDTIISLRDGDVDLAKKVLSKEFIMDDLEASLRASHMTRLNTGICNPASTVLFLEMIHSFERIADHCNNIAEAVLKDNEIDAEIDYENKSVK